MEYITIEVKGDSEKDVRRVYKYLLQEGLKDAEEFGLELCTLTHAIVAQGGGFVAALNLSLK